MYKVERGINKSHCWYEVMLSPFITFEDAVKYIEKYRHFYPENEQNYRIVFINEYA
jgi:hypothetical protein